MTAQAATILSGSPLLGTSAGSPMFQRAAELSISVSGSLSIRGTASDESPPDWGEAVVTFEQTNSGLASVDAQPTDSGITELRRLSGLTWDQLARLFGVARRSLHFWASGKGLNATNEERLSRLLRVVRQIDCGAARDTRAALLGPLEDGAIPFDMLVDERYDEVVGLLGAGVMPKRPRLTPLSEAARQARAPQKPDVLAGAIQDTAHRSTGKVRTARTARTKHKP